MILAILASLVLWPLYLALFVPLGLIGLVILAPLCLLGAWRVRRSRVWPDTTINVWRGGWLTWLWSNEEDGVTGPGWWQERTLGGYSLGPPWYRRSWSAYRWSALRNPVNNLRFVPWLNPTIAPARVRSHQFANGFFCWQGAWAGLMLFPVIRGQVFRFWLGWKIKPEDVGGVPDSDFRAHGCGFAIQFKRM